MPARGDEKIAQEHAPPQQTFANIQQAAPGDQAPMRGGEQAARERTSVQAAAPAQHIAPREQAPAHAGEGIARELTPKQQALGSAQQVVRTDQTPTYGEEMARRHAPMRQPLANVQQAAPPRQQPGRGSAETARPGTRVHQALVSAKKIPPHGHDEQSTPPRPSAPAKAHGELQHDRQVPQPADRPPGYHRPAPPPYYGLLPYYARPPYYAQVPPGYFPPQPPLAYFLPQMPLVYIVRPPPGL